ncbi:carboxynorspermidine decarboxylase [Psychrobacter sp. YP14]|uniref:Carboxynorspermidine/carboxyspermidine decarboxylase n=1 Tax=Psychrobacter sanguinis TaxID=861445 RepID=A0A844M152_9GAMM|nr:MULTISPECIES: carboxynorspermidine decarboxylase [Psychrobacter]AWT49451.1 carboxynorspermidine decarboxylase [Psychrobacter sp. YP14]MUG32247.1 carboxynorspermidine decarboxylase [Psychrobacter sanguinis]
MLKTPYYQIDIAALKQNLQIVQRLCDLSGAKALLALKCFATWGVFDEMTPYLHGTTSSSLNEVRLGKEEFGEDKETHAYSVAYSADEIDEVLTYADKIIFNSFNQLHAFKDKAKAQGIPVGLRINPKTSNSSFIIADPARPFSRLGEHDIEKIKPVIDDITGVMIHNNCENNSFEAFSDSLADIEAKFGELFYQLEWVSLGGGIHFIAPDYPLEKLAQRLKSFSEKYGVQVYLEPGEACIHNAAKLVTTVLDTLHNGKPLAVVDASIEAHMLDLLIYRETAPLVQINDEACQITSQQSDDSTIIYGKSCLAGDIFGEYALDKPLTIGDKVSFGNAAGYTMVKKNWFNGVAMPAIVICDEQGELTVQKTFGYEDFKASLS